MNPSLHKTRVFIQEMIPSEAIEFIKSLCLPKIQEFIVIRMDVNRLSAWETIDAMELELHFFTSHTSVIRYHKKALATITKALKKRLENDTL